MPQQFSGVVVTKSISRNRSRKPRMHTAACGEELVEQVAREDGHLRSRSLAEEVGEEGQASPDRQRIHEARESPRALGAQRRAIIPGPERLSTASPRR